MRLLLIYKKIYIWIGARHFQSDLIEIRKMYGVLQENKVILPT